MDFFKKEWKAIAICICLIGIIVYLVIVSSQIKTIQHQNSKIISTFGSIESVAISTDEGLNAMAKQVDKIEKNVTYIVKKVRRR
jgi:regulator of protease activity HflC (stomatin/prohibitin superfamily)